MGKGGGERIRGLRREGRKGMGGEGKRRGGEAREGGRKEKGKGKGREGEGKGLFLDLGEIPERHKRSLSPSAGHS